MRRRLEASTVDDDREESRNLINTEMLRRWEFYNTCVQIAGQDTAAESCRKDEIVDNIVITMLRQTHKNQ